MRVSTPAGIDSMSSAIADRRSAVASCSASTGPRPTLSATLSEISCGTCDRKAAFGGTKKAERSAISSPFHLTDPLTSACHASPSNALRSVDLPAPTGPVITTNSPRRIEKSTSNSTGRPAYETLRPTTSSRAIGTRSGRTTSGRDRLSRGSIGRLRPRTVLVACSPATSLLMRSKATPACLRRARTRPTIRGRKLSQPRYAVNSASVPRSKLPEAMAPALTSSTRPNPTSAAP